MKIKTNVRAGILPSPRCGGSTTATRCGGTPRCGGGGGYAL
ncbi:MAG: hypothetical protein ACXWUO_05910 [Allosphingosinicella sp.]